MIEFVDLDHADALDAFVMTHPNGHFMQTSLYGRARSDWDGWTGLICRRDGVICGTMAILTRQIRGLGTALHYAPRGPILDPSDCGVFEELIASAAQWGKLRGGYLLRVDPGIDADAYALIGTAQHLGFHISSRTDFSTFNPKLVYQLDLTGLDEETVFGLFHPKTRYNIQLAQRHGVTVREGAADDLPMFHLMMVQTAERDGFTPRSGRYYARLLAAMPENARLLLAEWEGQTIAGAIRVTMGQKTWFLYGCSDLEHRTVHPNELLQWEMIRGAIADGSRVYDLRGVEGYPCEANPHYGLHRFKQGFHAALREYVGQMDLVLRPAAWRLVTAAQKLLVTCRR